MCVLKNEIKRIIAISDRGTFITKAKLSPHLATLKLSINKVENGLSLNDQTFKQKVEDIESVIIAEAFLKQRWNQSKITAELGLTRVDLANKIKRYKLATQV